jgi:secreted trypsin-like serine protease
VNGARRRLAAATLVATALCVMGSAIPAAPGSGPTPRIVGGQPAPAGAYPWMTALVRAGEAPRTGHRCGATLIGPRRLLTAAHCLTEEEPKRLDAVVGAERLSAEDGERIGIARYATDPGRADLALLKLARRAPEPPLALAGPGDEPLYAPGQTARALGWGLTSQNGRRGTDLLRQVDVPIVSDEECALAYQDSHPPFRGKKEICAGAAGRDACGGDSGGPLLVSDSAGTPKQVGVVSFGRGCGRARFPGVYSEVPARLDFAADPRPIWAPEPGRRVRIRGRPRVGERLRCSDGRWAGRQIEFRFFWFARRTARRLDRGRVFVPDPDVAGSRVFCIVVAKNPGGIAFQQSKTVRIELRR